MKLPRNRYRHPAARPERCPGNAATARLNLLLEIEGHRQQLRLLQESRVHPQACRLAPRREPDRNGNVRVAGDGRRSGREAVAGRDDCRDIHVPQHAVDSFVARQAQAKRACIQVDGIGQVAARGLGHFEDLLAEEPHFLRAVLRLKSIRSASVRIDVLPRPVEVLRDLHLEFEQQHRELRVEKLERVARVHLDDRRPQARHRVDSSLCHGDQVGFAAVLGREIASIDADSLAGRANRASGIFV